jgi:CO dehydrogenase/acetyl-CoA synthase gamma subunit (corrinoid Fe-S protein)
LKGKSNTKNLILGKASRLSGEIEEFSGWQVMVGPRDSNISRFLQEKWKLSSENM